MDSCSNSLSHLKMLQEEKKLLLTFAKGCRRNALWRSTKKVKGVAKFNAVVKAMSFSGADKKKK